MTMDFRRCDQCGGVMSCEPGRRNYQTLEKVSTETCETCGRIIKYIKKYDSVSQDYEMSREIVENSGYLSITLDDKRKDICFIDETEDEIRILAMEASNDPRISEGSYVTFWNKEKRELKVLYGNRPENYFDFIERIQDDLESDKYIRYGRNVATVNDNDIPF